jgi:hypothetical protein
VAVLSLGYVLTSHYAIVLLPLQLEEMEAAVAAKLAQLAALQQENAVLKHKQEALESTIVIQEKVVAQLSALQVAEQQQQGVAAAAASSSTNAGGGITSSSSSRNAAAEVSALLAAVTGEPQQQPGMQLGHAAEPDFNNPAGNDAAGNDDGGGVGADLNNPDWAGITSSGIPVQRLLSGPQLGPEQLDVHMLLDRWGLLISSAAQFAHIILV